MSSTSAPNSINQTSWDGYFVRSSGVTAFKGKLPGRILNLYLYRSTNQICFSILLLQLSPFPNIPFLSLKITCSSLFLHIFHCLVVLTVPTQQNSLNRTVRDGDHHNKKCFTFTLFWCDEQPADFSRKRNFSFPTEKKIINDYRSYLGQRSFSTVL